MDDPIAMQARHDAELDVVREHETGAEREHETGRHQKAAELGRALIGLDAIAHYLQGEVQSAAVDIAQELGRRQLAFEERIEKKIDLLIALVRPFGQRLTAVESRLPSEELGLVSAQEGE